MGTVTDRVGWADIAIKADLAAAVVTLRAEMRVENTALFRKLLVTNFTTAVGLCALVFQIARSTG